MESEKRQYSRILQRENIKLKLDGRDIPCWLENISRSGAYISIDSVNCDLISNKNIGEEVELNFFTNEHNSTRKGVILRLENLNQNVYIAVYFKNIT